MGTAGYATPPCMVKGLGPRGDDVTDVRLLASHGTGINPSLTKELGPRDDIEDDDMTPTVRLALVGSDRTFNSLKDKAAAPALLVSFFYLASFRKQRDQFEFRDWSMDSGAYSAANSGSTINVDEYHDTCAQLLAEDPKLTEVFALDVIGDWRASMRNTERAWELGIPAIPTFHVGEPDHVLTTMAKNYPKIALGGAVRYAQRDEWAKQCFARVWPKPIHGLGVGSSKTILQLPYHSVDASNWEMGPVAYGRWRSMGGDLSVRGGNQNLRAEVEWYLDLERQARMRWVREMEVLNQQLRDAGWRNVPPPGELI